MSAYAIPSKAMQAAMDAHTNLTVYEAVVAILEGGTLSGNVGGTPSRIIAMCRREQQRQLKLMDKATADANRAPAQKAAHHPSTGAPNE